MLVLLGKYTIPWYCEWKILQTLLLLHSTRDLQAVQCYQNGLVTGSDGLCCTVDTNAKVITSLSD